MTKSIVNFDPLDREVQQNPFPFYARMREESPVQFVDSVGAWGIFPYKEVNETFQQPEIYSAKDFTTNSFGEFHPVPEVTSLIATDPPEHSRVRRIAGSGFRPGPMKIMAPKVEKVIDRILDDVERIGPEFDMVSDFAAYVPVNVTADFLGVEDPDVREQFKRWTADTLKAPNRHVLPEDELERMRKSRDESRAYFEELVEYRRSNPGDDFISMLLQAEGEDGDTLSTLEILSLVQIIQFGGSETPSHLISSTMLELFNRPEILEEVRMDASRAMPAVQETLRVNSPVQMVFQTAIQETEVLGVTIPKDSMVFAYIASANHDPAVFDRPDEFILDRPNLNKHLSFATGAHHCLGAPLGRMMCARAVSKLLERFPNLTPLDNDPEWMESYWVRGLSEYRFTTGA